jgi:hypothetical protein
MVSSTAVAQTTVFTADFEGGVPAEFSTGSTSNDQIGAEAVNQGLSAYLGKFTTNGSTTLTVTGLPAHSYVRLDVDVYFFNSWDGSNGTYGPDSFSLSGDVTFSETFTNHQGPEGSPQQSYPTLADVYLNNDGTALAGYGSASNTFAYFDLGPASSGTGFIVTHNSGTFTVTFGGPTSQTDEQWGIDNVKVTVCNSREGCQPGTGPASPPATPIPVLTNTLLIAGLILLIAAIGMVVLRRSN